jgi:hypothetical protein
MRPRPLSLSLTALAATALLVGVSFAEPPARPKPAPKPPAPDFNRDVRPILANHCLKCHGPDDKQRYAGLRLDTAAGSVALLQSGGRAVVPGKPEKSGLIERILAKDESQMPPSHANKPLSATQKQILRNWVANGARYEAHWAFVPPKQASLPVVRRKEWMRNPIDRFVLAGLEKAGIAPEPEADRYTLIRRVSLDLIGLPPTPEEADAFVNDKRPDAYERLVDRLLASPHYGERWARPWLDLARYADTNGYEKDRPRLMWAYRDWVINSLNADMPFNQFTIKQLAGDLLPNATLQDRIATGFNRNTMINEEGGADPLEYRFHAMTDRVATTGTTWMGLTIGCAQCHTHKYDPILHKDYFQLMAFLDNADEPTMDVPQPDIAKKRAEAQKEIARLEAELPNRFPLPQKIEWKPLEAGQMPQVKTASGATAENLPDGSVRIGGAVAEKDTYTVTQETKGAEEILAVRIEALTDPSLGGQGPGRTPHGNFVLTEIGAMVTQLPGETIRYKRQPVRFVRAEADFSQDGFAAPAAIDGKPNTGWAISGPGNWNVNRALTLILDKPVTLPAGARWTFKLEQNYGSKHTLGRFRISFGRPLPDNDPRPREERRRALRDAAFTAWEKPLESKAVRWEVLTPKRAKANVPVLRILPDASVLSTSDITKHDVYDVEYPRVPAGATALRMEVLPHPSLPRGGPGRVGYEGPLGDFFFCELTAKANGQPVKMTKAIADMGNAQTMIDGDPLSGWSINGGQGKPHTAIFVFEKPLPTAGALALQMLFEKYYAASLGRFRVSVTTDTRAGGAAMAPAVEEALLAPEAQRTPVQKDTLLRAFLTAAPELANEREEIEKIRREMPEYPTTLVFQERSVNNPRATYMRNRGEFLQPTVQVKPGVPAVLNPLPKGAPLNRLTFARWLVAPENPLTARVTVNRQWASFFGRGIVRSTEDFGYQGDPPTHPELLDYLAVEFQKQGWSLKKLHRMMVTSAAYRQSSRVTEAKRGKDPENRLISRGPRVRLEAELIRDAALTASGLLSPKLGGPSVFPPQPPGVTTEGAYGPLTWTVSAGEDRYRRGLYTFAKRTASYAMFNTFDAPTGEATCPRREVSNTPLQALALLNDTVFVEAAQALGKRIAERPGTVEQKSAYLFRRCVTRPPTKEETAALAVFYAAQKTRLEKKELDAATLSGAPSTESDVVERATWTTMARSLLNLDEAIVKR